MSTVTVPSAVVIAAAVVTGGGARSRARLERNCGRASAPSRNASAARRLSSATVDEPPQPMLLFWVQRKVPSLAVVYRRLHHHLENVAVTTHLQGTKILYLKPVCATRIPIPPRHIRLRPSVVSRNLPTGIVSKGTCCPMLSGKKNTSRESCTRKFRFGLALAGEIRPQKGRDVAKNASRSSHTH